MNDGKLCHFLGKQLLTAWSFPNPVRINFAYGRLNLTSGLSSMQWQHESCNRCIVYSKRASGVAKDSSRPYMQNEALCVCVCVDFEK